MKKSKKNELEQAGAKLPRRYVHRDITKEILPWLRRKEIIVLTGARQTGKSSILFELIYRHLLPKTEEVYYFNLDVKNHLEQIQHPDWFPRFIQKNRWMKYIILDEVQRLKEPGLFLKGIYDLQLPVKLIVSGSSALELKSRVHEALTGRKMLFHISPFNLSEIAHTLPAKTSHIEEALHHSLTYGGYPAVALAPQKKIKLRLLAEILQSYLEKDVRTFLNVENETAFLTLFKTLAAQIGDLVNKQELASSLGIHRNTLENYLFYLEQTYMLILIYPFHKNVRSELLKSPKVYFHDLGLRNLSVQSWGNFMFRPDKGKLFENFVYLRLKEKIAPTTSIFFWRTKAGAEVDFVVQAGLQITPVEAKASMLKKPKVSKSLHSFIKAYQPTNAYCVNLSLRATRAVGRTRVHFVTVEDLANLKHPAFVTA